MQKEYLWEVVNHNFRQTVDFSCYIMTKENIDRWCLHVPMGLQAEQPNLVWRLNLLLAFNLFHRTLLENKCTCEWNEFKRWKEEYVYHLIYQNPERFSKYVNSSLLWLMKDMKNYQKLRYAFNCWIKKKHWAFFPIAFVLCVNKITRWKKYMENKELLYWLLSYFKIAFDGSSNFFFKEKLFFMLSKNLSTGV